MDANMNQDEARSEIRNGRGMHMERNSSNASIPAVRRNSLARRLAILSSRLDPLAYLAVSLFGAPAVPASPSAARDVGSRASEGDGEDPDLRPQAA